MTYARELEKSVAKVKMDTHDNYNFRKEVADAPLRIIRQQTKQLIASKLDSKKLLFTDTMLHRDWRGLAEKANLDKSSIRSSKISSTEYCIHLWAQKGALIKDYWDALQCIDRYDIIDDTLQCLYDDYDYATSSDVFRLKPILPPLEDVQSSITDFDSNVLTTDDQKNLNDGGTLQFYDALVLFVDEDLDFVDEMVQKLEGEYSLKLCLRDRDLVAGLAFEFSAVMRLIEERCARVIVVLSPAFLKSNANKFLTQFAHSLSVEKQRRILIPCMYRPCQKPSEISFCHSLDYFRNKGYWDYWKKLRDSIVYKEAVPRQQGIPSSGPVLREIIPSPRASPGILSRSILNAEPFKIQPKEDLATKKEGVSDLFNVLPDCPSDPVDGDAKSILSIENRTSGSPTFSTAPLLHTSQHNHFGGILKRVKVKFKKKKNKW